MEIFCSATVESTAMSRGENICRNAGPNYVLFARTRKKKSEPKFRGVKKGELNTLALLCEFFDVVYANKEKKMMLGKSGSGSHFRRRENPQK